MTGPSDTGTHNHRKKFCEWSLLPSFTERSRGMGPGVRRDDDKQVAPHTGSAIEYFTWLSAKLDSIDAIPSSRVSLFFKNAS